MTRQRARQSRCENCGEKLAGEYCHACGQDSRPAPTNLVPILRLFLSYASGIEGTAVSTIKSLLFHPGALTRQFVLGKRVRYANPVQVYLWCTAVFFLLHAYTPLVVLDVHTGEVSSSLSAVAIQTDIPLATIERQVAVDGSMEKFASRFETIVTTTLPILLVVLVAMSALLLRAMFWTETALTHIVFALHWSAFYFILETLRQVLMTLPGSWGSMAAAFGSVVILVYVTVALHTVYGRSWVGSILRAIVCVVVFASLLGAWLWSTSELAKWLA